MGSRDRHLGRERTRLNANAHEIDLHERKRPNRFDETVGSGVYTILPECNPSTGVSGRETTRGL
ncbi:hypothetical protein EL22_26060, partial [Halostagnicola sp. A56]